jgi:hypothetical protein
MKNASQFSCLAATTGIAKNSQRASMHDRFVAALPQLKALLSTFR